MSAHTPGPWLLNQEDDDSPTELYLSEAAMGAVSYRTIHRIELYDCVYPEDKRDFEEAWANARLIAAAPELLAACHKALGAILTEIDLHDGHADVLDEAISALNAAIAKAEGRS